MYGKDYSYASSRLCGTIVRHKGNPVMVESISYTGHATVSTVVTHKQYETHLDELDVSCPEMGMLNTLGRLKYVVRMPMRRDWKQGVRRNNVKDILHGTRLTDKEIYRVIRGNYPSYAEAICKTMEEDYPVAFHRHWAVSLDGDRLKLLYKWYGTAGYADEDGTNIQLRNRDTFQFKNLEQALLEAINEH